MISRIEAGLLLALMLGLLIWGATISRTAFYGIMALLDVGIPAYMGGAWLARRRRQKRRLQMRSRRSGKR